MPSRSAAAKPESPGSSTSSPSAVLDPLAFCSDSESPSSFSLTQQAAEALWAAVEAKAALETMKQRLAEATAALDALVAAGALPEKNLPTVGGFTLYRQEGRVSWSYPEAIKELEGQIKKRKQLAEQLGEATQKRGEPFWTIKPAEPLGL